MPATRKNGLVSLPRPRKSPLKAVQIATSLQNPSSVLFLDIETTGLSRYYDELTLVGYSVDGIYRVHIAGDDQEALKGALADAETLVTFNGILFDIPFLKKTFGNLAIPNAHIDLRYVSRRVGLTGGQKQIERDLGINLREGVEDVDGRGAVLLWYQYLRGDMEALRKLIAYNEADVRGMWSILDRVMDRLDLPADLFFELPKYSAAPSHAQGALDRIYVLPGPARLGQRFTTFLSLFGGTKAESARIVGIDLTGSEKRASGFCILQKGNCHTQLVSSDEEIIEEATRALPALISIDSPLSLPRGRTRVGDDDPGRSEFGIMRVCERTLKRRGVNVYPALLPSMQKLTQRGMLLADRFRKLGIPVIESYPGAAQDIMGIPRKGAGENFLKQGLAGFGLTGDFVSRPVKHDELDAITAAVVGSFFLAGRYEALSAPAEDALIIPDLHAKPGPLVVGLSGRIGSGKTTAARFIEAHGFSYVRFSEIIDDIIRSEGRKPDRIARQEIGWRVNRDYGQRWLCEKLIDRVGAASRIVIDGLRFPEDHAFLIERFSSRFIHIHLETSLDMRIARLEAVGILQSDLLASEEQPTESNIDRLGEMAEFELDNEGTKVDLKLNLYQIVDALDRQDGIQGLSSV